MGCSGGQDPQDRTLSGCSRRLARTINKGTNSSDSIFLPSDGRTILMNMGDPEEQTNRKIMVRQSYRYKTAPERNEKTPVFQPVPGIRAQYVSRCAQ